MTTDTTDTNANHLRDYLAILRRRKKQVLYTAAGVFFSSAILAFILPTVYRSTATILIEQQEVPPDLVATTVTGYANQRIQIITKRLVTHDNLRKIVEKLNLYPEKRQEGDIEAIITDMRGNIEVETVSAKVTDPRSGRSGVATIAFTLSYDADTPERAQKVADELVDLFLKENQKIRTQKAERTSNFISEEEKRLGQYIAELEAKLAAYKERNTGRLPELMNLNMQLMGRAERELEEAGRQIYQLEERKLQLESQLAQVQPHTAKSPAGRLKELQIQYLSASAVYAPNHPDVIRMRREIETLKKEVGIVDEREVIENRFKQVRSQLAAARKMYSEGHPDVTRLKTELAALEKRLKNTVASSQLGLVLKPDNPAYISLHTQLGAVKLNLRAAKERRARAKQKSAEYELRVVQTPRVEQEGLALQREYDNAVKKYREIKQSLMGADLAVALERGQEGGRYSILEHPELPGTPERPNRRAFLLLGIVLGLGSGVGYASIAEYMDRTVRGSRSVTLALGTPPLAVIPYISDHKDPYLRA